MNGTSSHRQLCDRILSWASNISPSHPSSSESFTPEAGLSSPVESVYQGSSSSPSSSGSCDSSLGSFVPSAASPVVSTNDMELDFQEDVSLYRYHSDIYGNVPEFSMFYTPSPLESLPDPVSNPLITLSPDVIEEEYSRVLEVRNKLQESQDDLLRQQRIQAKQQAYEPFDWSIEQQLFESSLAIQKANSAAEYIMNFCFYHNVHVDFDFLALSLGNFRLPTQSFLPAVEIYDEFQPFAPDAPICDQSYIYGHSMEGIQPQMVDFVF